MNRYWDAIVGGEHAETDSIGPTLAAEVRRLHTLDGAFAPDPAFLQRLQAEVVGRPDAAPGFGSRAVPRPRPTPNGQPSFGWARWRQPLPARRWGPVGQVATIALLLVTLVSGFAAYRLATPAEVAGPVGPSKVPAELYIQEFVQPDDAEDGRWWRRSLDPLTLADRSLAVPIGLDFPGRSLAVSADGSTSVTTEGRRMVDEEAVKGATFVVRDGLTGPERTRFTLPLYVEGIRLSGDASRLVVAALPDPSQIGTTQRIDPPEWHLVDTGTGRILGTVPSDTDGLWHDESWIDPAARRLYRLMLPHARTDTGPGPARLTAHDLITGEEIGRLELPEVRGGTWATDRTIGTDSAGDISIFQELRPGVALSPDGRRFAFVHADEDAVTLVDAERLVVERSVSLARPTGFGNRLLGWLSLAPQEAQAKRAPDGARTEAAFAADGRHLYVTGDESKTAADGSWSSRTLPLRVVDLDDGDIVAEEPQGDWFTIHPAADGRDLYVAVSLTAETGSDDEPPMLLRRLDPLTLEVRAEREFPGYPYFLLQPAVPNGSDAQIV